MLDVPAIDVTAEEVLKAALVDTLNLLSPFIEPTEESSKVHAALFLSLAK